MENQKGWVRTEKVGFGGDGKEREQTTERGHEKRKGEKSAISKAEGVGEKERETDFESSKMESVYF